MLLRMKYYNQISDLLWGLNDRIRSNGKLNDLEMHKHSETVYMHLLNRLYSWNLSSTRTISTNYEAIDLIDTTNKIAIQVTATATRPKVEGTLKKEAIKNYRDFKFKFVFFSDTKTIRKVKKFKNPHGIKFNPQIDIIDLEKIRNDISVLDTDKQLEILVLLEKELGLKDYLSDIAAAEQLQQGLQEGPYKKERKITVMNQYAYPNYYHYADTEIMIDGHLPTKFEEKGSCNITFANLKTMITLSHCHIMALIQRRKNTTLKNLLSRGSTYGNTKQFTCIETTSVHLDNNVFDLLEIMLSDFLNEYEKQYAVFERFMEVEDFERIENSDQYQLLEIDRLSWKKLLEHSEKFDSYRGEGPDYCFSHTGRSLIAVDKTHSCVKFYLLPDYSKNYSARSFLYPDDNISILWKLPSMSERNKMQYGAVWSARETHDWIRRVLDY